MNRSNEFSPSQSAMQLRADTRKRIKQQRQALTKQALHLAEQGLSEQVLDFANDNRAFFGAGRRVAGYLSTAGEIPLETSLRLLRASGASTWLPVIRNKKLLFAPLHEDTEMEQGKYDISIPVFDENQLIPATDLHAILVPLVAFDATGNRLGMGGGYYDRSFAHLHPDLNARVENQNDKSSRAQMFVGVAHAFQQLDAVPVESWDIPLDAVISEQAIHRIHDNRPEPSP